MHQPAPLQGTDIDTEYRAIEATLLGTARGRWFLAEHGRRARRLDGVLLEEAIGRVQSSLRQPPALLSVLKNEIEDLIMLVETARAEALSKPAGGNAPQAGQGPPPVHGILAAAEAVHELAWSLQAKSVDPEACETLARRASEIYALSTAQAVESTRALQFTASLDLARQRLAGLLETVINELQTDAAQSQADDPAPVAVAI